MDRCSWANPANWVEAQMTAQLRPSGALLDEIHSAVQQHGRPRYALFTTYTFDAHLFTSQFLPLLCGEYAEDDQRVGLLVVCDARSYVGHRFGPWVTTWPGSQLFHPKVSLLVFRDKTLLFAGSGNLTDAGQYNQIEVVGKESWDRPGLPEGLAPLVSRLDAPLPRALLRLDRLRSQSFACSLGTSFAKRLKRGRVDEIVVVSPFFDAQESGELDDLGFVATLVKHHAPTVVRVVVPVEASTAKERVPKVQIDPRMLRAISPSLQLYGIDPAEHDQRRLHAKLLALCRKERARLIFGSANATTAGMTRKNVEAGWFVDTTRSDLIRWLKSENLLSHRLNPNAVQLGGLPRKSPDSVRSPLQCARLDEVEATLTLVWRSQVNVVGTSVIYEGKSLWVKKNVVHGFRLGRDWFVKTRAPGQNRFSFAPIEIARELSGARRAEQSTDPSSESLLDRLVAAPELDLPYLTGTRRHVRGTVRQLPTEDQPLYERIRKLAGAMATARQHLREKEELAQRMATVALLIRIAKAADPATIRLSPQEALWQYWIRVEIARVLAAAPRSGDVVEARKTLDHLLKPYVVPSSVRKMARMIRGELVP